MPRIRLIIEYDGSNYVGWQTQPNGPAVQQRIEKELKKLTGDAVSLHGSGRTDSGVHALAQVAHFDTKSRIPPDKFAYALNAGLPRDIRVKYSDVAPEGFHARFDVVLKQYRYTVLNSPHSDAFLRDRALHVHYRLDVPVMEQAASFVLGEHDFAGFMAAGSKTVSTVRMIALSYWETAGEIVRYHVAGNGFLYNMVRILVGTMLEIGMGLCPPERMREAISGAERALAGATAPAHGLLLERVKYDGFDTADYIAPMGTPGL